VFEYFPTNYPWSMAVLMGIAAGGNLSEIDEACRALVEAAKRPEASATDAFFDSWKTLAERVETSARADEREGRFLSAGRKYRRASAYWFTAERLHRPAHPERIAAYARMLECFGKFVQYRRENCERLEIPYGNGVMPALYTRAEGTAGKAPCMVHFDGLDGTKELMYLIGISSELARRGISTLIVDHPGVGEALRLHGMKGTPEIEKPASAAFDYAAALPEVDAKRVGIMAVSLGGYYAPRAAAFDPRWACAVAWGALYDWGPIQRARSAGAGTERSVSHYAEHLMWVFGKTSVEECLAVTDQFTLKGLLHRITCPLLVVQGERDRQLPREQAERTIAEAVNSPGRRLHIHTAAEGGVEHCSVDNFDVTVDTMSDWIAQTLK
jgi:dienelactone hydrolase